jgi:signal transduction histidine kinase
MKRNNLHLYASRPDAEDIGQFCRTLLDFPIVLHAFHEKKNDIQNGEVILIAAQNNFEEIIRVAAELRIQNPHSKLVLIGDAIPPLVSFHTKAALVIGPSQVSILREVYSELELGNTSKTESAAFSELQEKNKELEKINFELDRFVYSASHDLRSPLTSVLGLLYLLRNEIKDKEAMHYVDLMEESILKLDNIIRDIVAYSRNNRTQIQLESLELSEVVKDISTGLRYLETDELSLKDVIEVKKSSVLISDRTRIQIILNNLISNAIKYRHIARKPKIQIKCEHLNSHAILTVEDNGMGIKDEHLNKIFDMFYRTNDQSSGSGLGLYIVKETVKKLGGEVNVRSEVNNGTTFTITIPDHPELN